MKFDFTKEPGLFLWDRALKTEGKPLISIITAFYNAGKHFEQTYNSVINQTFPWFEWIIVDDGSTDEFSLRLLDDVEKRDGRIKILHQENTGLSSSSRNSGIAISTTDLIFPLDADDIIEPTCLEYEYWALLKNKDAAWAYSDSVGFQGQEYLWTEKFDAEEIKKRNLLTATALIRKKAILDAGGYSVREHHFNEDWHLWLKIIANGGYPVQITGEYLFWYRRSQTGVLSKVENDKNNREKNTKLIRNAASFIINSKEPVIYPTNECRYFEGLHKSDWDGSIYKKHDKIHVLCLFPWLEMGGQISSIWIY